MRNKKSRLRKVINVAFTTVMGVAVSFSARKIAVCNKNYIKNTKFMPKVASELNIDTDIMKIGDDEFDLLRLKPNLSKKVYVYIDESVPEKTRGNIKDSLDKFNYIFDYINDDYNLEVCSYEVYLANKTILNSTIKFEYTAIDESVYGKNVSNINKTNLRKIIDEKNFSKNVYVVGSTIYLNKTHFEYMNDLEQQSVINHELLHSFGFNDIYDLDFSDETSLMNPYFTGLTKDIGPNDLKILYVAYGKKHIDSDENFKQEKMDEVKNYIYNYENEYYNKLITIIKNQTTVKFQKLSYEDIQHLSGKFGDVNIQINNDGKNFSYIDSVKGQAGTGRVIKGEDYAILPDIISKHNRTFLIMLKNNNNVKVYNFYVSHNDSNVNINELSLE